MEWRCLGGWVVVGEVVGWLVRWWGGWCGGWVGGVLAVGAVAGGCGGGWYARGEGGVAATWCCCAGIDLT